MPVQFDTPAVGSGRVVFDEAPSGPSPYSPEGMAASRQAVVQSRAAVAKMREEQAQPQYRIGLKLPFIEDPVLSTPIPAELAAFGSEAAKGVLPTGAGLSAASAVTPYSKAAGTVMRAVPGLSRAAAPIVEYGVPLVAAGAAGLLTRAGEDVVLPQILPDAAARSYELTANLAAENPTSAMLGQFAGSGPFFRPGLPIGTTAADRLRIPLISGAIGGGIEGAQQIAEGDFDAQRLAIAAGGSALLNRETKLGARTAPNLVPKSTQILAEPTTKPPSIANVATEVATQTEKSPYALQTQLNNMTADQQRRVRQLQLDEAFGALPPKSAEESATVLAGAPELPPSALDLQRQAQAAAARAEADATSEARRLSAVEGRIQNLVDELSGGDAVLRAQILGRRRGMDSERFLEVLEGTSDYRRAPERQPDVIAGEIERGVPGSEQAGRIVPEELGAIERARASAISPNPQQAALELVGGTPEAVAALRRAQPARADAAPLPGQIVDPEAIAFAQQFPPAVAQTPAEASAAAIESGLTAEERLRQSAAGGQALRQQLAGRPLAPVEYVGIQEGLPATATRPAVPDIEIFNLTEDIPGHPAGSTVSRQTLEAAGFEVPTPREQPPASTPEPPRRPNLANATGEEIDRWADAHAQFDKDVDVRVFGEEGAKKYRKLTRTANSYANPERADAATAQLAEMEAALTKEQQDILYGMNLPPNYIDVEQARSLRNAAIGIDSADTAAELVRESSRIIQRGLQAASSGEALGVTDAELIARVMRRAKEIDATPQQVVAEYFKHRAKYEGRDVFELAGTTPEQVQKFLSQQGGPTNASSIESTTALGEQPGGTQGTGGAGSKGVEPGDQGQVASGNQVREGAPPESRLGYERGAISPAVVAPLGGSVAGAITGAVVTDREPGESDEAYAARKLRNTALGAAAGAGLGSLGALAMGAKGRRTADAAEIAQGRKPRGAKVATPEGNVRQTAEKVIENRAYPEQLRQTLADDPDILYDKFALNDLAARVRGATPEQLQTMMGSADVRERLGAIIELGNRAAATGQDARAAELYSQAAQHFTNPAQILGLGKLVRSPQAMVDAVNESLKSAKRKLSGTQADELKKLATQKIKTEQAMDQAEARASADFSEVNEKAWKTAQMEHAMAARAMDEYVHQVAPESWGTILSKTIQGNLLTPLSLASNVFGNLAFQPVRRGAASIASALDAVYSPLAHKERSIARGNPLPTTAELEAAADGLKVAAKEMISGPSFDSYIKAEVQRGFRPLRSLASAFSGKGMAVRPDGSVALTDRMKKLFEGTLGIAPEVMFRFLNLGDKPFRRAAQAEILMEQARIKGLKGRDLAKFMDFPDKKTQELLDTEGRRAIFAEKNVLAQSINKLLDFDWVKQTKAARIPGVKDALQVMGRMVVPFRQFPLNYVSTALNFVAPEVGLVKALAHGAMGDRRTALTRIGEAALGTMMYGAAHYLWDKGLISEPTSKDPKKRSVQYDQMGPQRLNVSGLERSLAGGDPNWQSGDTTIDWGKVGIPSAVFYVYTKAGDREKSRLAKLGQTEIPERGATGAVKDRLGDYLQMAPWALDQSMLSGTASFLEAIKEAPDSGALHAWTRNMFRAVTSIAVPNSIEALARAEYKYLPELKGETLADTLKNTWDFKIFQLPESDRKGLKRDLWGDPIPRTPEGKNPYIHQFVDVTGSAQKSITPWKKPLLELFNQTESPDVYPTPPGKNITVQGVTAQLTPEDHELLQQVVGAYRKRGVEIITASEKWNALPTPEQKIYLLDKMYSQAAQAGQALLMKRPGFGAQYFPELTGAGVPSEDESRVVNRSIPARARVRVMEETK